MNRRVGDEAEIKAARYLSKLSWRILFCNFYTRFGELDIIALDGEDLVFIEVRYRRASALVSALESIDPKKQHNLLRAAEIFLSRVDLSDFPISEIRFDLLAFSSSNQFSHIRSILYV